MDQTLDSDAIRRRVQTVAEQGRATKTHIGLDATKAGACALLMIGAAYGEIVSATIAINAAYPRLSDGTSTADAIMGVRYTLAFYALLGHVVIASLGVRSSAFVKKLLGLLGVAAILLMLFGMGLFSFAAVFQTIGGDDSGQPGLWGRFGNMSGPALGMVCASTFTISFIAACSLASKLVAKLGVVFAGLVERARLADLDREIAATNALAAQKETLKRTIAEAEKPGALADHASAQVGRIVGNVTAEMHEAVITRRLHEGVELRDEDDAPLRDVPLPILTERLAKLEPYTPTYFRNLLLKKED